MFNAETPQQTQSLISSVPGVQALEIETTVDQDSPNTNTPSVHPATDRYPALLELRASSPPPLREWFIEGFVPEDSLTILSGDGGLGKSYLALHMAQCIARGEPFLSREVKKARVLWVDAESLGEDELMRRSFQLAYGRGENETPPDIYYFSPKEGIGADSVHKQLLYYLKAKDIKVVIVDSLSIGAAGDMKEQRDVTPMLREIIKWGTVIAIDHITKSGAKGNQSQASIFGSVFKRNMARSTLKLVKSGTGLKLSQDKNNYGQQSTEIRYTMTFSEIEGSKLGKVTFSPSASFAITANKEQLSDTLQKTLSVIRREFSREDIFSVKKLSEHLDVGEKQTRTHLNKLVEMGLVIKPKRGVYQLADAQQAEVPDKA